MPRKKKKTTRRKTKKNSGFLPFLQNSWQLTLKAIPTVVLTGIVFVMFIGVKEALYADPSLDVARIVVKPIDALSTAKRAAFEKKFLGKNIFKVDLEAIANEIEKDPQIRQAQILRSVPSTITIEIEKRTPFALVQFSSKGHWGLMAKDGMILDVMRSKKSSFVQIEAFHSGKKKPVMGRSMAPKGYVEAVRFLEEYWKHPLSERETVTKVVLDRLGNVNIVLGAGPEVRLGRHPAQRIAFFDRIQPILLGDDRKNIDYIDLQFEDVVIKRKR